MAVLMIFKGRQVCDWRRVDVEFVTSCIFKVPLKHSELTEHTKRAVCTM